MLCRKEINDSFPFIPCVVIPSYLVWCMSDYLSSGSQQAAYTVLVSTGVRVGCCRRMERASEFWPVGLFFQDCGTGLCLKGAENSV